MTSGNFDGLDDAGNGPGFLKAGLLGFQKSGKTWTAALMAVALMRRLKIETPVAMFDTETGSGYIKPLIRKLTGKELLAQRRRSFDDMMTWGEACVKKGIQIAILDSATHPWREMCESYRKLKNRTRLQFQDWAVLKDKWGQWTNFYLNSPLHIIICGRAGYEYDYDTDEEGKKELIKTGIKMKTESEFGFEPSLLIEMERTSGFPESRIMRGALVIGDRFGVLDGHTVKFDACGGDYEKQLAAVDTFFAPHFDMLVGGELLSVDTTTQTDFSDIGDDGWPKEKRNRDIYLGEIKGLLEAYHPGTSADAKKQKSDLAYKVFGVRGWEAVAAMNAQDLSHGLKHLRKEVGDEPIVPLIEQEVAQ